MEEVNGTVAVIGAVGTLLTVVIGALGTWALKIYSKRSDNMLAMKKLEVGAEKGINSRTVKELREALAKTDSLLDKRGDEVHAANDKANAALLKYTASEARLEACERDRTDLWDYIEQITEVLRANNMNVPVIVRRGPSAGGEQ